VQDGDPNLAQPLALLPKRRRMDGRVLRSERTKQLIIEAYLELLKEGPEAPTAAQIAKRAGYSVRSVFERFDDLLALTIAAADYAFAEGLARSLRHDLPGSRMERLRAKVERRSLICERWLPLWRILLHHQSESEQVKVRIERIRDAIWARLASAYSAELAGLPDSQRKMVLITLEQLIDFESWGRMREHHGLSIEEAREAWVMAIDRLLPPTPPDPGEPATV
jgi:AcrR family transcriptional regulator